MVAIALAWRPVLVALGAPHVSRATVIRWYFVGEIGKYVPGGIWSVAGRSELSSRRGGMPRSAAYGSVALSLFLLEVGAAIVAAVAIPFSGIEHKHPIAWLVILLLPVGFAVLHPRALSACLRGASKAARRDLSVPIPDYGVMLRLIAGYVPAWFAIGGGTWAIARSLDPHAPFGNVFTAAVISWIVGFLLVPVPGGVGVREGAFTALVSLPKGIAATAAILARLAFMLVDGGGAVLTPLLLRDRSAEQAAAERAAAEPLGPDGAEDSAAPTSDGAPASRPRRDRRRRRARLRTRARRIRAELRRARRSRRGGVRVRRRPSRRRPLGRRRRRHHGAPWRDDTVVLVYSSTKGVTSVCANLLVERGRLDPDAAVVSLWPEFGAHGKDTITIGQVLSHQAGLPYVEGDFTLDEALSWTPIVHALEQQAPIWPPGTKHGYHMRTFGWLAGELIRRADPEHRTAGRFLAEEIAAPLGLNFWIGLPEEIEPRVARLVPPERDLGTLLRELAPDMLLTRVFSSPGRRFNYDDMWNTRALHACELPSSNGIGDARSLARLYAAVIGSVDGTRVLRADTLARAMETRACGKDEVLTSESCFGLGFMLGRYFGAANPPHAVGPRRSRRLARVRRPGPRRRVRLRDERPALRPGGRSAQRVARPRGVRVAVAPPRAVVEPARCSCTDDSGNYVR